MITQFILKPIVDLMLVREPFNELTDYLWKTQSVMTNIMGQTNNLQFRGHDVVVKNPSDTMLVVESMSLTVKISYN